MSADATDPDEIGTCTEYIHDGCLVNEIDRLDLSDLEFDDNDDWLYIPPRCSTESAIHDLYVWLKTEPEVDIQNNRKCIDTRTFTRPKKRSSRMSFESILEGLSSSFKGIWKPQSKDVAHTEDEENRLSVTVEEKESVPLMLKPSLKAAMNVLADENVSGQESMEAFLNMSQSKGIDSFINLDEPEFNDLLMNMSQPSILYTSVTSSLNEYMNLSCIKNNTTTNTIKRNDDAEETLNSDSSINETFVMQTGADETIVPNDSYCTNLFNNTFCKEPAQSDKGLNETYDTEALGKVSISQRNLDKEKNTDAAALSSTFVTERNVDATFVQPYSKTSNDIRPLDVTYLSSAGDPREAEGPNLGSALTKNDTYISATHSNKADLNVTCDIVTEEIKPATFLETHGDENALDISFKVPFCNQSTPMNPNMQNPMSKFAMKHSDQSRQTLYSTLKAPTSLRRELLAEIQRSGERKLDSTYNHIPGEHPDARDIQENICIAYNENEIVVPSSNRYNTYRKSTVPATMTMNQYASRNETVTAQTELPDQRKFYTFTKKSNNYVEKADNTGRNAEVPRLNMDSTFCKPLPPKAQKNAPRMLSKLPQFLQKSNPNLVSSSLKTGHSASGLPVSGISSIGYIKGSQPNIVQNIAEKSQLSSKLHPCGKLKSGSEQRLLEMNVNANNQFPMKGLTAGSTESIESTQSVQSAPDLDDRLSTCSDSSSQNSCTRRTMNIEQLHQLVRMQEESLKQDSAPRPNIQVLENTWVKAKTDLPSPILKNGVGYSEIDSTHSMPNTDLSMKCSSPIISPIGSSHALNNDETSEDNVAKIKDEVTVSEKTEDPDQLVPKVENKTRLRQPTNWGTRSKPAAVISGIPRPASRIPALRFARPNVKAAQSDLRKGCT